MQIRAFRAEDAEQAYALRVEAFSSAAPAEVPFDAHEVYIPDEHRIVAVEGARVVGHLGVWPMHQVFMGCPVSMGGVGAVTVAHDRRGAGVGSRLIAAGLDHMAAAGMAISTLFASTPVPYRRWGWEVAGDHVQRRVATRDLLDLPAPAGDVTLRPYEADDLDAVHALLDAVARDDPGGLQVGVRRVRLYLTPDPDESWHALVAVRDGRVAGLLQYRRTAPHAPHDTYGLHVLRLAGDDHDITRALWRNLAHHYSTASVTTFRSCPAEPLLFDLPYGVSQPQPTSEPFMTRLIDASAAIAARGWPGVTVTVALDIADQRRPANAGPFVLEVRDGAATLTPGGRGGAGIDIGALASLYSGFVTPAQLARAGRLTGTTDRDLIALRDAFAAPAPFTRETF